MNFNFFGFYASQNRFMAHFMARKMLNSHKGHDHLQKCSTPFVKCACISGRVTYKVRYIYTVDSAKMCTKSN